jgi:hypothetical protein
MNVSGIVVILALSGTTAGAASRAEGPETVFAAARTAAALGRVEKTPMLGAPILKTSFREAPLEGALLVGFELGLGKFVSEEAVYALRPIYRTEQGEMTTRAYGLFEGQGAGNGPNRSRVTRTVRLLAQPGYAVGGITVRRGIGISGMSVTFLRLTGTRLDPRQAYTSEWVGGVRGEPVSATTRNGAPVVGIFGNRDDRQVLALGLLHLDQPEEPASPPPPPSATARTEPAPPPPPARTTPAAPAPAPAVESSKPAPPAVPVAAAPPRVEAQEEEPAEDRAGPGPAAEPERTSWFALVGFFVVLVPVFLLLLVYSLRKGAHPGPAAQDAGPASRPDLEPVIPVSSVYAGYLDTYGHTRCAGAQTAPRPRGEPNVPSQPPYFQARATFVFRRNRLYRVYVRPGELLFLDAGPEPQPHLAAAAGVSGGLLGALVGWFLLFGRQKKAEARRQELDRADTRELQRMALEKPNLQAAAIELSELRIELPGFWHRLSYPGQQRVALLRFKHFDLGQWTLEFPTLDDLHQALETLTPILGDRLAVRITWDDDTQRYVPLPPDAGPPVLAPPVRME